MNYTSLVAHSTDVERQEFYKKTYLHVAGAILAFIGVEYALIRLVPEEIIGMMLGGRFVWLFLIGVFWLGSTLANKWSLSLSRSTQYLGLGFFILLEAAIFLPMLYIAAMYTGGDVILYAAGMTLALFIGLTGMAFTSGRDFSFLRSFIVMGGVLALGVIILGAIFGFQLGLWFSMFMVLLASASILYETQKLQYTYTPGQYVGASLQLFSSVMLLFWYILRILMDRRS